MQDFVLRFGRYKGYKFYSTPISYQDWLLSQDWFKAPTHKPGNERMPKINPSWDGYSRRGQAQENAVFEWEKRQSDKDDCANRVCTCCPDSMYYGL